MGNGCKDFLNSPFKKYGLPLASLFKFQFQSRDKTEIRNISRKQR